MIKKPEKQKPGVFSFMDPLHCNFFRIYSWTVSTLAFRIMTLNFLFYFLLLMMFVVVLRSRLNA